MTVSPRLGPSSREVELDNRLTGRRGETHRPPSSAGTRREGRAGKAYPRKASMNPGMGTPLPTDPSNGLAVDQMTSCARLDRHMTSCRWDYCLTLRYVALLRAISNLPMQPFRDALEELGFDEVTSYGTTGNLLFAARKADTVSLEARIERKLEIKTIVRYPVRDREDRGREPPSRCPCRSRALPDSVPERRAPTGLPRPRPGTTSARAPWEDVVLLVPGQTPGPALATRRREGARHQGDVPHCAGGRPPPRPTQRRVISRFAGDTKKTPSRPAAFSIARRFPWFQRIRDAR